MKSVPQLTFVMILTIFASEIQVSTSIEFFYLLLQHSHVCLANSNWYYINECEKNNNELIWVKWPGSQCNTKEGCCYTATGKPHDFVIAGLQPFYFNGTLPEYCHSQNPFDLFKVMDLKKSLTQNWASLSCPYSGNNKLWAEQWQKYGTCSELDEHQYFSAALNLKKKANLLSLLSVEGIKPNGRSYQLGSISDAIVRAGLHLPGIGCSVDKTGNSQLNQIILCTDSTTSTIVECPGIPMGQCATTIKFSTL